MNARPIVAKRTAMNTTIGSVFFRGRISSGGFALADLMIVSFTRWFSGIWLAIC